VLWVPGVGWGCLRARRARRPWLNRELRRNATGKSWGCSYGRASGMVYWKPSDDHHQNVP